MSFVACNELIVQSRGSKRLLSGSEEHIETVVHEKRRDHVCGYCKGVAFGRASTLKAHISAIHLKIKRSRGAK